MPWSYTSCDWMWLGEWRRQDASTGELKPGRKGLSMIMDQFQNMLEGEAAINNAIQKGGVEVNGLKSRELVITLLCICHILQRMHSGRVSKMVCGPMRVVEFLCIWLA